MIAMRRLSTILLTTLAVLLGTVGCTFDRLSEWVSGTGERTEIILKIQVPGGGRTTRALSVDQERAVGHIWALIFDENDKLWLVEEAVGLQQISEWQHTFSVALPRTGNIGKKVKLVLFANAMGAYATAYYLVSSSYNIVPIRISALMSGDVRTKPELGSALAITLAMVLIVVMLLNDWTSRMAARRGFKS